VSVTVNPLVAARNADDAKLWTGLWLAEDIELIVHGVRSNSWVDTSLGAIGASLDGLAFVSDPVSGLLQYGISWMGLRTRTDSLTSQRLSLIPRRSPTTR
jgi:hypothetical protein